MSLRSPLSRVLGSGSAKEGTEHWWMQRVTAIGLLLLGAWFLVAFAALGDYSHAALSAWVGRPGNSIMLLLLGLTLAWHSALGVQVVIEDYVHGTALKVLALIASRFIHILLAVAAALAVMKVFLGSAS